MSRKAKNPLSDEALLELVRRYPDEQNDVLATDFGLAPVALRWLAHTKGWRKTRKFKEESGRANAKQRDEHRELLDELVGAEQRAIHSGLLLVQGNRVVHLAK